jgi:hypothetical protein
MHTIDFAILESAVDLIIPIRWHFGGEVPLDLGAIQLRKLIEVVSERLEYPRGRSEMARNNT